MIQLKITSKKKHVAFFAFVIILSIFAFIFTKYYEKIERERKLEARFDRFMGYYYPYLKDIADASSIYKRMEISLMYDYLKNKRGRYIHENVNYYDGGMFSMQDEFTLMTFLKRADMLNIARCSGPINFASESRCQEQREFFRIIYSVKELLAVNIYDESLALYGTYQRVHEQIDSLDFEIKKGLNGLAKYKNASMRVDLNSISNSDYELDSY